MGSQPHVAAQNVVGAAGHVDKVLRLGSGDVDVAALRLPGGDLGQDLSYVVGCDRLNE